MSGRSALQSRCSAPALRRGWFAATPCYVLRFKVSCNTAVVEQALDNPNGNVVERALDNPGEE